MTLDQFFTIFIAIHAIMGIISLAAGTISVIASKGGRWHTKSGKIFYYAMMIAGISGIVASLIPGHIKPFLFVVGIFSIYLVLSGYRALAFVGVKEQSQLIWDKIIAFTMGIVALGMIAFGGVIVFNKNGMGWVLIIFGVVGLINGYLDLKNFKDLTTLRKKGLQMHIGKITGGYIAAFTAFLVTNQMLPPFISWLLPTIFGSTFIAYWLIKTKKRSKGIELK